MKSATRGATLLTAVAITACNGTAPTTPAPAIGAPAVTSGPQSVHGEITLRDASLEDGSNVPVRVCSPADTGFETLCADLGITVDVLIDRAIPDAAITVDFVSGGITCGFAVGRAPLSPGVRRSITTSRVLFSGEEWPPRCLFPAVTNRVVVTVWAGSRDGVLRMDLPLSYAFVRD